MTKLGWRGYSLLIPSILSAIGLFCFAVLAYSFTELQSLDAGFRRWLVIVGAFTLAAGSEIGTLANVVDIYRKGGPRTWDWLALTFSLLTTIASFVLAFAALLLRDLLWITGALNYGAVVLGILAALDSYGGFMELGLYLSSRDKVTAGEYQREVRLAALDNGRWPGTDTGPLPSFGAAQVTMADVNGHIDARRAALLDLITAHPEMSHRVLAEALGCSPSTVRNDLSALGR